MEVVPPDDERAGHLRRDNLAGQNAATDRDVASERAFFVCGALRNLVWNNLKSAQTNVCAANGLCGGLEAKTNILVPALLLGGDLLAAWTGDEHIENTDKAKTHPGLWHSGRWAAFGTPFRSGWQSSAGARPERADN